MITGRCPNDGKDVSSGTEHEHYSKPGNSFCSGSETVFEKSPPGIYLRPVVSRPVQAHLPVFIREHVQPSACEDKSHITRYCIYADSPDRYRVCIHQQFRKFPASCGCSICKRKSSSDLDLCRKPALDYRHCDTDCIQPLLTGTSSEAPERFDAP